MYSSHPAFGKSWLLRRFLIVFGAISVSGCMVGPDFKPPEVKLQSSFTEPKKTEFTEAIPTAIEKTPNPVRWWADFNDPTLNDLLARAARDNLSLQRAAIRIYQARSQLGVADASLFFSMTVATDRALLLIYTCSNVIPVTVHKCNVPAPFFSYVG
jgi:hypothetical protein